MDGARAGGANRGRARRRTEVAHDARRAAPGGPTIDAVAAAPHVTAQITAHGARAPTNQRLRRRGFAAKCRPPKPKPIIIEANKNNNSSGSLIAERKRTIDSAPTSPSDRANEDLTTAIKAETLIVTSKRVLPNELLELKVFENL